MNLLLAGIVLILLSSAGAWYGYRRGRRFVITGVFMIFAALGLYALAGWSFAQLSIGPYTLSLVMCAAIFSALGIHCLRRWLNHHDDTTQHVLWRYAGLGLGVGCAPCVGLLLGVLMQSVSAPAHAQTHGEFWAEGRAEADVDPANKWAGLRSFGVELTALSSEILQPVPVFGDRAADLTALMYILNTSPEKLATYAQGHEIGTLVERPPVRAALLDLQLGDDIAALASGDLLALHRILDASTMRAVLADDEVLAIARRFNLQEMAAELAAIDSLAAQPAPASNQDN